MLGNLLNSLMKNNLFIRLYFLIVISNIIIGIGIGIGINWIWQNDSFQQLLHTNLELESKLENSNLKQYELLISSIAFQIENIADLHKGIIVVQQSKLGGAEFIFKWKKNNL